MLTTGPNIIMASLMTGGIAVWTKSMISGTREYLQHKAAHHHITMMNQEVARRWREHQLNADNP